MKHLILLCLLSLSTTTLYPQQFDSTIQKLMDAAHVTGLSIGIISNRQITSIRSYGYGNFTTHQLLDTATSQYAASLSKAVFAYLIMQLTDQGKIALDTPLYRYLPQPLPAYDDYKDLADDDRWKLITARHCLSHTTGFPNWRFLNPNHSGKLQIFFTPGTRYAYSGEGIALLQMVVEAITQQPLDALAQQYIFQPLGMTHTSYIWQPAFDTSYAVGHGYDEKTFPVKKRSKANAAGSMQTTIADYTRFMAGVIQGKGLSQTSRQEMLSPQIMIFSKRQFPSLNDSKTKKNKRIQLSYGLGWGLFISPQGPAFFKEGHSDDGWVHYAIGFPDTGNALVIMSNSMNGESIFKELIEDIEHTTIPWEWENYIPYQKKH